MADEVIRHLESIGIVPSKEQRRKKRVSMSPEILMELSACLRLNSWLEGDLCDGLKKEDVDAVFSAMKDSLAKLTADARAFSKTEGLPLLTQKVFDIWEKHCAWSGLDELSADVLLDLSPSDGEEALNELAELLWNHRHAGQQQRGS
ncbi:MAG: hypothetical protein HY678_03835 [Chloroflexi bacterium]|nr:hypothetical protein [Chloroflexota bacterium]